MDPTDQLIADLNEREKLLTDEHQALGAELQALEERKAQLLTLGITHQGRLEELKRWRAHLQTDLDKQKTPPQDGLLKEH